MNRKIINFVKMLFNKLGLELSRSNRIQDKIKRGQYDWMRNLKINSIIDVGANDGGFANIAAQIYPKAKIFSFEPLKEPFEALKNNTKHIKNINYYNWALGSVEGESIINHNEFSPSSSLLEITKTHIEAFPNTKNTIQEKIIIKTLDGMISQLDISPNVLLKIDVQGYELNVLKGAGSFLQKVDAVIIETSFVELYRDQAMFDDIYNFLNKNGFVFRGNIEQLSNPYNGEILQADSLFIKNRILPVRNVS